MKLEYKNSSLSVEPEILDNTSSPKVVYVRKNIVETEVEQEDGSIVKYYNYLEAKIDKSDWEYLANLVILEDSQNAQDNILLDLDFRLMTLEEGI